MADGFRGHRELRDKRAFHNVNTGVRLHQSFAHSRVDFSDQVVREFSFNPRDQDFVFWIEFKSKAHAAVFARTEHFISSFAEKLSLQTAADSIGSFQADLAGVVTELRW
jgi:hypothetical protein